MDLSRGLVTALVDDGSLGQVTRSGITEVFLDDDVALVYNYIQRYHTDYKKVPSRNALKEAFPNFSFTEYDEPLQYFIDQLKESYRRSIIEDGLILANRSYLENSKTAESHLRELLGQLSVTQKSFRDRDLAETALERIAAYDQKKLNPGANGILSGWDKIDYTTLGWQPEEFVVLVGERYIGKSWLLLWLAYKAMLQKERVLFVTQEMSQEALERRFDAIYSNIEFDSLRRGELSDVEEQRFKDRLQGFHNSDNKIILARDGVNTIEDIEQKAIETDATVVFADSVYLFNPSATGSFNGETPRRLAISQRCKQAARTLGIPFITSTQGRRKQSKNDEPSLDRIEWSNAFSQDADTVLWVDKTDVDEELNRLCLHLLKCRDGDRTAIYVDTNFTYMTFTESTDMPGPSNTIELPQEEATIFDD